MKVTLTNMVLIRDKQTNKVVVIDRKKKWPGLSLPGGHVEASESFVDSTVREAKEETGLDISKLESCGVVHWVNTQTHDRYISFLYQTTEFTGTLLSETDEGKIFWMDFDALLNAPSVNGLPEILQMYLGKGFSEAFGSWHPNGDSSWRINEYK